MVRNWTYPSIEKSHKDFSLSFYFTKHMNVTMVDINKVAVTRDIFLVDIGIKNQKYFRNKHILSVVDLANKLSVFHRNS